MTIEKAAGVDKEYAAFERLMRCNTARLTDFAKLYAGRLSGRDRGMLLQDALTYMWQQRESFNPKKSSLLQYWDQCLRAAAMRRRIWNVSTFDGWTTVTGAKLGAENL